MFAAKFIILLQPGAGCFLVWVFIFSLPLSCWNQLLALCLSASRGEFLAQSAALWYVARGSQDRSVQWAAGRRKKLEIRSQSADWKLRFGGCGGNHRRLTAGVNQEHLLFWLIGYTLLGSTLSVEGLRVFALFSRRANSITKNWKHFSVCNFAVRIFSYEPGQSRNENYFMCYDNLISLPERELWERSPSKYPQRIYYLLKTGEYLLVKIFLCWILEINKPHTLKKKKNHRQIKWNKISADLYTALFEFFLEVIIRVPLITWIIMLNLISVCHGFFRASRRFLRAIDSCQCQVWNW